MDIRANAKVETALLAKSQEDLRAKVEMPTWKRSPSMQEGPFGPIAAVEFVDMFRRVLQPCILKITYPSAINKFGDTFRWILTQREGARCQLFQEKNPPDIGSVSVSPTTEPGIVLRLKEGFGAGAQLARLLDGSGFRIVVSHKMPTPSPDNLIWIDIGPGSPWK